MKRTRNCEIPTFIHKSLQAFQNGLNALIDPNWIEARRVDDWSLALFMEAAEVIDSYPWKWWKNINGKPDISNVKVEVVDLLHFSLSGSLQCEHSRHQKIENSKEFVSPPGGSEMNFKNFMFFPLSETSNAISSFRNIITLAGKYQFDLITEGLIAAAEDLDFNLTAFYVAKHTLNYIRQLNGYKSGTYVKVKDGVEDNVLLHDCIKSVSLEDTIDSERYIETWNSIITNVYNAFEVPNNDRKSAAYWLKQ